MVLGAHTILKEDHFPGCQSPKLPEVVQGAPNFRGARGFNVYGSALPTVDGIRRTLQQVNCQPASQQADSEQVCSSMLLANGLLQPPGCTILQPIGNLHIQKLSVSRPCRQHYRCQAGSGYAEAAIALSEHWQANESVFWFFATSNAPLLQRP